MRPANSDTGSRLLFLDWLRILAFFALILYHVGMYYVTWGWHVKSQFASDTIEPLMMLSAPWRLGLLFMISGAASSFMLAKMSASAFMRQRSHRLLIPLLFGMLVVVPPQSYFEVVEKVAYQGSYFDFMKLYLSAYHGFCRDTSCLIMPTWNHLWFVAYLWVYTLLLGALVLALGAHFTTLARRTAQLLTDWRLIVLPVALLAVARIVLLPRFPETHNLVWDWYSHAHYFFLFLLGALLAPHRAFWERLDALRWQALGAALSCWAFQVIYSALPDRLFDGAQLEAMHLLGRTLSALCQWGAIVAACGFAHRHLQFDSVSRRYLTEAVFPIYILHQTLIVTIAHALKPAGLPPMLEGAVLVVLTVVISFCGFEAVRRYAPARPLFGLGKVRAGAAAAGKQLAPA